MQVDSQTVSHPFRVLRGVRQGDPLSPILFNNVTRVIFAKLKKEWARKKYGIMVCAREDGLDRPTHCAFADDTTLLAKSKTTLLRMLRDVKQALAEHGLNLNLDKCTIQCCRQDWQRQRIELDGICMPVVDPSVGFKILGTKFTLRGRTSAELRSRIAAGWAKFHQMKPLLCRNDGLLDKRLRMFDSTVGQSVLWCSESWIVTKEEKRLLTTAQNCMLRKIAGPRRAPDEDWVTWVQRSTRIARERALKCKVRLWADAHLKAKWTWAGHVQRMQSDRLAVRATVWRDSEWWRTELLLPRSLRITRPCRTRWFRWEDDLKRYAKHCGWACWQESAANREVWLKHRDAFAAFAR